MHGYLMIKGKKTELNFLAKDNTEQKSAILGSIRGVKEKSFQIRESSEVNVNVPGERREGSGRRPVRRSLPVVDWWWVIRGRGSEHQQHGPTSWRPTSQSTRHRRRFDEWRPATWSGELGRRQRSVMVVVECWCKLPTEPPPTVLLLQRINSTDVVCLHGFDILSIL